MIIPVGLSSNQHSKEGQTPTSEKQTDKQNNIIIPYGSGSSEKLPVSIPVHFRASHTLRQKHGHNSQTQTRQCSACCAVHQGVLRPPRWKNQTVTSKTDGTNCLPSLIQFWDPFPGVLTPTHILHQLTSISFNKVTQAP